jgi:hypothetical protein
MEKATGFDPVAFMVAGPATNGTCSFGAARREGSTTLQVIVPWSQQW